MAEKYRLNQEIKYLHKKKALLNTQLYKAHLECANLWQQYWPYEQAIANEKISKMSNSLYEKLNKKTGHTMQHTKKNSNINNTKTTRTYSTHA
jgi:hypothetical protein